MNRTLTRQELRLFDTGAVMKGLCLLIAISLVSIGSVSAIEPTLNKKETAINSLARAYTAALITSECERASYLPEGQARVAWRLYDEIWNAVRERYPDFDYHDVWRFAAKQAANNSVYSALCAQMPQTIVGIYIAIFLRNPPVKMTP